MAVKLFFRLGNRIKVWGEREGAEVSVSADPETENHKGINAAKRRSRELQKAGYRFERPA
jgi:hypothetical protein